MSGDSKLKCVSPMELAGHSRWADITPFMYAQYNISCGGMLNEIQGLPLGTCRVESAD